MKNSALPNSSSICWLKVRHRAKTGCLDSVYVITGLRNVSLLFHISTERKFCMEAGRELLYALFKFAMTVGDYDCGRFP